jgi:amino acid adenylation domain-containing protein
MVTCGIGKVYYVERSRAKELRERGASVETLEDQLRHLSPDRRLLVELWLRQKQAAANEPALPTLIPRRPPAATAPLSFAQQRLWFLDQLEPGQALYNMPRALRLEGPLDLAALSYSLTALVARHETLRTHFVSADGLPLQVIAPASALLLPLLDLQSLPAAKRAVQQHRLATAEVQRPFDLTQGPLLRVWVLRLAAEEHLLLLTLHHIVADHWSLDVLVRELSVLYRARLAGQVAALPELPIQYADYALWQRGRLSGVVLESQLVYWRQQLAGLPQLALPTDRPPPARPSGQGATVPLQLPLPLSQALLALSRKEGVTLFMTLLAAFQTLLMRYSGQEDIAAGTPIAGRTRAETEGLIGFFVNTLVLRTDLSGQPSFVRLLARVREVTLQAYAHQELPFELLVAELQPERDLRHNPLFQVMLALQNVPLTSVSVEGLTLTPLALESETAKFDLTLTLTETEQGLRGRLEYRTDLFDAPTIARLACHFQTLLEGVVADPDHSIATLPLLTEAERSELLAAARGQVATYPALSLHALFAAQAARTPDTLALLFEEQQLTYAALDTRSEHLAHYLRALGLAPEDLVAICMERSLELLVAVLGILKAGGAYVPLDPSYPKERLAFMLEDSRAPILITATTDHRPPTTDHRPPTTDKETRRQGDKETTNPELNTQHSTLKTSPLSSSCTVVDLNADWPLLARMQPRTPPPPAGPQNLAYAIYTSGSTGAPKGVLGLHGATLNRLAWMWATYPFAPGEVGCHKTALSFVDSVWEIFGPLLAGVPLVVIPRQVVQDAEQFVGALERCAITRLVLVPSLLQTLLAIHSELAQHLPHLRYWTCSGEALPVDLARRFQAQLPHARLLNLYGSSEVSADATCYELPPRPAQPAMTIGRPIANTQIYVLDAALEPVPIGVVGEIYVGGVSLARGYLNRPDLTAERFVPNPFADQRPTTNDQRPTTDKETRRQGDKETGQSPISNLQSLDCLETQHSTLNTQHSRLYRTGDQARYLPDGNIEYLGRSDQQVKLRGYRIELGEIEAALIKHAAVHQAVVAAREDAPGHKSLVAYIVPTRGQGTGDREQEGVDSDSASLSPITYHLSPGELRVFLGERLPSYMLPAAFVLLDALPLTPNGKLDRRALPAPNLDHDRLVPAYEAPRTAREALLAQLWAQVLGVPRVGIHDTFFALGGDSLLVLHLVARMRQAGMVIAPHQLFTHQTIASLVSVLDTMPPAQPYQGSVSGPLLLAPSQLWLLQDTVELQRPYWNMIRMFEVPPNLDCTALARVTAQLLHHHDGLRTRFAHDADGWRAFIVPPDDSLPFVAVDLAALPDTSLPAAIAQAGTALRTQIDLARGPLLLVAYLDCGPTRTGRLLLINHHLVVDGYSEGILWDDLLRGYQQLAQGRPLRLPPKTTPLPHWTAYLHAYAQTPAARAVLETWCQLPWNAIPPLPRDLPTPHEEVLDDSLLDFSLALDPDQTQQLVQALLRHYQVPLAEALLAALLYCLMQWSPERWFGLVVVKAGRDNLPGAEDFDLSRTVGWLSNRQYVILERPQDAAPATVLEATIGQLRRVPGLRYELHRYLSQDAAIVERLNGLRPYEVLFNYINQTPITDMPVVLHRWYDPDDGSDGPHNAIPFPLECWPALINGRLRVRWAYSTQLHRRETIERLGQTFLGFLRALAAAV